MVLKRSRFGPFWACTRYPACKGVKKIVSGKASPNTPSGVACPECGEGELVEKRSRRARSFWGCNRYPKCKHTIPAKPVSRPCPTCGHPYLLERTSVKKGTTWSCPREGCDYRAAAEEAGSGPRAPGSES
jgi:DNA topoisomerase-1